MAFEGTQQSTPVRHCSFRGEIVIAGLQDLGTTCGEGTWALPLAALSGPVWAKMGNRERVLASDCNDKADKTCRHTSTSMRVLEFCAIPGERHIESTC